MQVRDTIRLYCDPNHEYRWSYVRRNGRIMGDSSESYKSKIDAIHGADVVTGRRLSLGLLKLDDRT
jgi:uncharacterized protein YegP (UPF0339 family)